jgi:hypothetical protein
MAGSRTFEGGKRRGKTGWISGGFQERTIYRKKVVYYQSAAMLTKYLSTVLHAIQDDLHSICRTIVSHHHHLILRFGHMPITTCSASSPC